MVAIVLAQVLPRNLVAPWAANPRGARGYLAGIVPGIVSVNGAPAAREVDCRHRLTRTPVARTFSAPDGTYRFDGLPVDEMFDIVGRDFAGLYNDFIWTHARPEPYSITGYVGAFHEHAATRTLRGAIDIIGGETGHVVAVLSGTSPPGIAFAVVTGGLPTFDHVGRWLIATGTTVAGDYTWTLRVSAPDGSHVDIACAATFS